MASVALRAELSGRRMQNLNSTRPMNNIGMRCDLGLHCVALGRSDLVGFPASAPPR